MTQTTALLRRLGLPERAELRWLSRDSTDREDPAALLSGAHPGRVVAMHGARADVLLARNDRLEYHVLGLSPTLAATPITGDWVLAGEERILDLAVRHTTLSRPDPRGTGVQILAANIDHILLVLSLEHEPSLGALERLAVLAWDSGAQPLTVLTKADTVADPAAMQRAVSDTVPGMEVLLTSAVTGLGLNRLREIMAPGTTTTMLGASGAGKTSLLNALEGRAEPVREVGAAGQGRHTTTSRQLYPLTDGGMLLDLPGIRSLDLLASEEGVDETFAEITEAAKKCRFGDCTHTVEPGCAVLAAVEAGDISRRRLISWQRIHREIVYRDRRGDAEALARQHAQWRAESRRRRSR